MNESIEPVTYRYSNMLNKIEEAFEEVLLFATTRPEYR